MTPLSPDAQAVFNAADGMEPRQYRGRTLAAVLRAAAKLEDIKPGHIGPCDSSYGSYLVVRSFSERDFNYILAIEKNKIQVAAERKLFAIAAELDGGTTTPTES